MKRILIVASIMLISLLFLHLKPCFAIEDPLSLPNNKMGIHILFPSEISSAAKLVNSSGGDWGYVTIPIQAGDRDLDKWQTFMSEAKKVHLIPIIRLATAGDYFNTTVWSKPNEDDIVDFANFLNSLNWPVKNRYIIVFNEVNRADEWGGEVNPGEYANLLNFTVTTFKSLNQDFFIISSGLDNAAANVAEKYMNEYDYMLEMNEAVPGIFKTIDGLGSHSYPNPGFRQMPYLSTTKNIYSYTYENNLVYRLTGKYLPVFITETGWSKNELSEDQIALYFRYAFEYVWSDKNVVAVTPFLLSADSGPFSQFSLVNVNGECTKVYSALQAITKTKGCPTIEKDSSSTLNSAPENLPLKIFPKNIQYKSIPIENSPAFDFSKWFLKLFI
jgi:hypothetical protein